MTTDFPTAIVGALAVKGTPVLTSGCYRFTVSQ